MSTREDSEAAAPPIESRADLLAVFEKGCKPKTAWRIGTEHEKFVYRCDDHAAPPYEGERGIGALLEGLTRFGWTAIAERGKTIALKGDDGNVSLEPAGCRTACSWAPRTGR